MWRLQVPVAKDDPEPLILMPPPPKYRDDKRELWLQAVLLSAGDWNEDFQNDRKALYELEYIPSQIQIFS